MANKEPIIVTKPIDISNLINILSLNTILFRRSLEECRLRRIVNYFTPSRTELESIDEIVDPFIKNIQANPEGLDPNELIDLINRMVNFTYSMQHNISRDKETILSERMANLRSMDKAAKQILWFQLLAILFSGMAIAINIKEYLYP
jgi:hypothetical protein